MLSHSTVPDKVRGFIIDKDTGHPLPGVVISAVAEPDKDVHIPLGILVSDVAGYVAFDLKRLQELDVPRLEHLWLYAAGDETIKIDLVVGNKDKASDIGIKTAVFPASLLTPVNFSSPFWFKVDARLASQGNNRINLPSIQNPDLVDWELSPYSFAIKSDMILGEEGCVVPLPSTEPEREYRFLKVVRTSMPIPSLNEEHMHPAGFGPAPIGATGRNLIVTPVDSNMVFDSESGMKIMQGEVLEYKQKWIPKNHSLGTVLYSLALAPCESVNIAVIDWSRKDEITRSDTIVSQESLNHSQRRDRAIDEAVHAVVDEKQKGSAFMAGLGGAASGTSEGGSNFGGVGSIGGSISESWGNRDLTANSGQSLHDSIIQQTNVNRSLYSTVVVQATQEERNYLQTRTVTNHNHCHALTIQYYELLRHFKVVTEYVKSQPVVLIPFKLLTFNAEIALRFRTILESVILDSKLIGCFDAIIRSRYCPSSYSQSKISSDNNQIKLLEGTGPLYRLEKKRLISTAPFPKYSIHHLYTTGEEERENAKSNGYSNEVVACYVFKTQEAGTIPLYRLSLGNPVIDYFYTTDENEKKSVEQTDYNFDNIACYVYKEPAEGTVPLFRLATANAHFYTINTAEFKDYTLEGTVGYVFEAPAVPAQTSTNTSSASSVPVRQGSWPVSNKIVNTGIFIKKGTTVQVIASGDIDFGTTLGIAAPILDADGDDWQVPPDYPAPQLRKNSLICQIGSKWYQGGKNKTFVADEDGLLVLQPNDNKLNDNSRGWDVEVYVTTTSGSSTTEPTVTTPGTFNKENDICCEMRLLLHLNNNIGYYNRAIWLLQDLSERGMILDKALASFPDILEKMDTTPIAVGGNYVAFPFNVEPAKEEEEKQKNRLSKNPLSESIVSIPTRGVFAETHLSHCNACEVRDVTRFWKWDESPCEKPPSLEGITPGPRGQTPSITPTTLPSPVVQVNQPPAAPDPVGLVAALNLLGQPNIFRDMSGMKELENLLAGLASGAVTLAQGQQQLEALKNKQGIVNRSLMNSSMGGSTGGKSFPTESDPSRQVDKLNAIQYALDEGLISEKQAADSATGVLGGSESTLLDSSSHDRSGNGLGDPDFEELDWERNNPEGHVEFKYPDVVVLWNFAVGSADIQKFVSDLWRHVDMLKRWTTELADNIIISGFASVSGSDAHNQSLALNRASRVKAWLVNEGKLPEGRIQVVSYGSSLPVPGLPIFSPETRAHNRRVEIRRIQRQWATTDYDRALAIVQASPNSFIKTRLLGVIPLLKDTTKDDTFFTPQSITLANKNQGLPGYEWLLDPTEWDRRSPPVLFHAREEMLSAAHPGLSDSAILNTMLSLDTRIFEAARFLNEQVRRFGEGGMPIFYRKVKQWADSKSSDPNSIYYYYQKPDPYPY